MSLLNLLAWIAVGLLAGGLAKLLVPGKQKGGCLLTMLLGIAGAFVGGWISGGIFGIEYGRGDFAFVPILFATLGAVVLLLVFELIARKKGKDKDDGN